MKIFRFPVAVVAMVSLLAGVCSSATAANWPPSIKTTDALQGQVRGINMPSGASEAGVNIKMTDGTIYMVTRDGYRRAYTSAGAFESYGFNSWKEVKSATAEDMQLPLGTFIPPRDGKVMCADRGEKRGTCYLITQGRKAGFVSEAIFKGQGFTFGRALKGDLSWMEEEQPVTTATEAHRPGTIIKNGPTFYSVTSRGVLGIPTMEVLMSWGYLPADAVPANSNDLSLPNAGTLGPRNAGNLSTEEVVATPLANSPATDKLVLYNPALSEETWIIGANQNISWSNATFDSHVDIYLYQVQDVCTNPGGCPVATYLIAEQLQNVGYYNWVVGQDSHGQAIPAGKYLISISGSVHKDVFAYSSGLVTLVPGIQTGNLPDYQITDLKITPQNFAVGEVVTITFSVVNYGSASGTYPGLLFDWGDDSGAQSHDDYITGMCTMQTIMQVGQKCSESLSVSFTKPGLKKFTVAVNGSTPTSSIPNKLPELNYLNNTASLSFTVTPLAASSAIKLAWEDFKGENGVAAVGTPFVGMVSVEAFIPDRSVNYYTLKQQGQLPPGIYPISLCDNDYKRSEDKLTCGVFLLGAPTQAGTYQFQLSAATSNGLSGSNSFSISVAQGTTTPAQYSVQSPTGGQRFEQGDKVAVQWSGEPGVRYLGLLMARVWSDDEIPDATLENLSATEFLTDVTAVSGSQDFYISSTASPGRYYIYTCFMKQDSEGCNLLVRSSTPVEVVPATGPKLYYSASSDARRLADIRQLASALELYYNDKMEYPVTLDDLAPAYIGVVPKAPEPAAGTCTVSQNAYSYRRVSAGSYELSFCLGQQTGGYPAGIHKLTELGVD